jgi:peptidoglycan-associated lipoprotein
MVLTMIAASGCRSPKTAPPRVEPLPVASEPSPAVPVPAPRDFSPSEDAAPRVDIAELNATLRQTGLIADAFFAYDSAILSDAGRLALQRSAMWLRDNRNTGLLIEGHCDERGTEQYNLALGDRRAAAASSYLQTLGIDRARVRTISYGEERPFADGTNEAAWAQNRRAHLVITER